MSHVANLSRLPRLRSQNLASKTLVIRTSTSPKRVLLATIKLCRCSTGLPNGEACPARSVPPSSIGNDALLSR